MLSQSLKTFCLALINNYLKNYWYRRCKFGIISMRLIIKIITILFILASCRKLPVLSLKRDNQSKIIALQPLEDYDEEQLLSIQNELSSFFNTRVLILKTVPIPPAFRSPYEDHYSADSLIQFLLRFKNDSICQVVGLTHKNIYTLKNYTVDYNNNDTTFSAYHSIRGLGYISQNACIISDGSLISNDRKLWSNRVLKSILHEVGHNLGLGHCKADNCLMSEKMGEISTLNKMGGDYCKKCRQKLD